jgi:hypothetical protein
MFEFDRPFASIDLASKKAIVLGFIKRDRGGLVAKHHKKI